MRNLKPALALVLTAIGSALVATFHVSDAPQSTATTGTAASSAPLAGGTTALAPSTPRSTTTTTTPAAAAASGAPTTSTATFTDGTYTGTGVREPWGTFEVQATISGGKLTGVTIVSAPSDGHSNRINTNAVPLLTQAAIAAQSAQIDTISGATWTSRSYITSLQAALDAAAAAALTSETAG